MRWERRGADVGETAECQGEGVDGGLGIKDGPGGRAPGGLVPRGWATVARLIVDVQALVEVLLQARPRVTILRSQKKHLDVNRTATARGTGDGMKTTDNARDGTGLRRHGIATNCCCVL